MFLIQFIFFILLPFLFLSSFADIAIRLYMKGYMIDSVILRLIEQARKRLSN